MISIGETFQDYLKFTGQGGSAANNAGTDGTDLGVFGANFNFDTNGRPDLWPYMTSLTITNTSVPSGQDINVEFTAQKKN